MLNIAGFARYLALLSDEPRELRSLLQTESGRSFRRINRFTELALIGALRCHRAVPAIAPDAALYVASESPMLGDCVKVLNSTIIEQRPPTPFEFMNISGNMAGFYIAQQIGIDGPQLAIARRHAGLEAALELLQLPTPTHRHALLGCVEEGVWPLTAQRQRVDLAADAPLFETSHWFYCDADCAAPLATLLPVLRVADEQGLQLALSQLPVDTQLAWQPALHAHRAHYAERSLANVALTSQGTTAEALCLYLESSSAAPWCHITRGGDGAFYLLQANRHCE